jgi:hypothetical protein
MAIENPKNLFFKIFFIYQFHEFLSIEKKIRRD